MSKTKGKLAAKRGKASAPESPKTRSAAGAGKSGAAGKPAKSTSAKSGHAEVDLDEILPEGKLYYRIGEVSSITGVKAYVLRYWESEFRWMAPQKSRSKQRLYRRKDIETILLIRTLLYEERYTIAGARQRLRELGAAKAAPGAKAKRGSAGLPAVSDSTAGSAGSADSTDSTRSDALEADYRVRFRAIREELVGIRALL